MAFTHRLFLAVIFNILICGGYSIRCFYCNSANNSACLDMHQYDDETVSRLIPAVECAVPDSPSQPEFFCRKIVQIIYRPEHEAEYRVTRGCGWVRDQRSDKPCYSYRNSDHVETVCQCFSERCNSAETADPPTSVILFVALSAVLYFY